MGTIAEKLSYLNGTKNILKTNLINKGVALTGSETFRELVNKVNDIQAGSGKVSPEYVSFYRYTGTSLDLSWLDTSNIASMSRMFESCSNLTNLDLSNFNTSNVTNMANMFTNCSRLTNLDVSKFNTNNVTDMKDMFSGCGLIRLDLSNFNTSNVTDMSSMFYYCQQLTSLDLSNFNTSNVTDMSSMFNSSNKLASINVSNFDTSKVTKMNQMFATCPFTSLDLSSFNTSNVTNMTMMFGYCSNYVSLDLSSFNTSNVTNMQSMFTSNNKAKTIIGTLDMQNVTNVRSMFSSCPALEEVHIHNLGVSLSLSDSPNLTHDCLVELINNLQTVTSTKTLTLGSTNLAKLTDAEKQVATNKGWTLA